MQTKKLLIGAIAVLLLAGGAYVYSGGGALQGKFGVPIVAKPDLTVTSISNVADVLTIVVKNSGGGNVTSGTAGQTYVYIDDLTVPNKRYSWSTLSDTAFFTAESSSTLETGSLDDGIYEVMACVDATSIVTERSESNNCLTETVIFGVALPDLIPDLSATSFSISGEVGVDASGNVVDVDVIFDTQCGIENTGFVDASGTSYNQCFFLNGSSQVGRPRLAGSLSLAAGSSSTFTKSYDIIDSSSPITSADLFQALYDTGSYTLTVSHETDYATTYFIEESDETNNNETETITIDDSGITWVVR